MARAVHTFYTDDGDEIMRCPTQTPLSDRRELELSKQGFIAPVHCKTLRRVFQREQRAKATELRVVRAAKSWQKHAFRSRHPSAGRTTPRSTRIFLISRRQRCGTGVVVHQGIGNLEWDGLEPFRSVVRDFIPAAIRSI
jgi:hypothetical protein